jgi:MYXO-CTERM domain-containing protein
MRQAPLISASILLASLLVAPTAHAVPLLGGFGGPAGYGTGVLPGNDDGSSSAIDLRSAFPDGLRFFGGPYTQFWVNNNGNITFSGPVFNFTPMRFPIAARPMIAPYWADVDTRNRSGLANPNENLVYWHLEPGRLIVTWYNVGYFSNHNERRMNFQLVITNTLDCGSGDFDVEFRYDRCEWTTGDASGGSGGFGGTPAQAGFDAGNTMDFVELPGSFTRDILNLCTTSNVGQPGIWQFSVRSGGVVCPDAGEPCEIAGQLGPCAVGRTQCIGREVVCQPVVNATPERCDGVDNDCDGAADDEEDLCTGLDVCIQGRCVPPCFEGGCAAGFTCDERGACVETACVGVDCPANQRCVGGVCTDACSGIVCPFGRVCEAGRCVDPCSAVTCESGQICVEGICRPTCPCLPCGAGESCNFDGTCTPRGCDIVLCDPGFHCLDGLCLDSCDGVVCPTGQRCEVGECVDIPPPPPPDAGPPPTDAGPPPPQDSGTQMPDAGTMMVDGGRPPPPPPAGGCGCRVESRGAGLPAAGWLALALLGLFVVRRRR